MRGARRFLMPYSPMLVKPMREELTSAGVEELQTPADVDRWMGQREGTALPHPAVDVGGGLQLLDAGGGELLAHRLDEHGGVGHAKPPGAARFAQRPGGVYQLRARGSEMPGEAAHH